ncbi:restriction endonuclease subunit S [Streptococcus mitis]|uniref:restriction endonuclease subunit S n=1 Tax=Streptococcus mitis TaxID=28037 RepID=UPI00098A993A|nr:restriction endonuclease subunit S [Streptococcus mitis]
MKKQSPKIINTKLASIWRKEKLRNIAPLRGGFAFKSEKFQNTGIPIVRISNIKFDGTVGGEFECYSKIISDEKFVLRGRSILLAMSGATTGKIAMLDSEEEYYQNQRVGYFQNTGEVDYDFLSSVLQTKAFTNQLNGVLVAGAQPNISSKEIDSFEFCIPDSIDEQSAIGSLFRTLDDLLASYKDNLINYQSLKATMLSKMFPKAGQTVPEIRLDGFEEDWERKSLSEVCTINSGRDYKHLKNGDIPVYGTGGYMLSVNEKLSDEDAIGIGRKGTIDKPYLLSSPFWTVDTLFYVICKVGYDLNYLFLIFQKIRWKKFDESTGVPSLSKKTIEKVVSKFPSYEEQQAIGSYFSNLDNLINSHQEKISQLETLKKKLLQDMFI